MLLANAGYLDPLADALRWDWRSLQRCVLVSSAWRAAMSPVKDSFEPRLGERLESLRKSCAERAAAHPRAPYSIMKVEIAEIMHMKCPSPGNIRAMSLVLHILGTTKKSSWLPEPGLPSRPGGNDYIFWNQVKNGWHNEQLDQLWREDARLRDLNVASVPFDRLEDLYQRREEPYLLPEEAYKFSPLAGKLAEWMQALVADWRLVRDGDPEAPTLLALKNELPAARRRAQEQRAVQAWAEEEERLAPGRPAEDAQSRALVEAQEHFATHLRVS